MYVIAGTKKENPGFVMRTKGKLSYYYYIKRNKRDAGGVIKQKNLYSLGNKENAIKKLSDWIRNPETIPSEINEYGFKREQFEKWLEYVENK